VAAALIGNAKTVTVVDLVEAPFQLALGKEVGNAVRKVCWFAADFNLSDGIGDVDDDDDVLLRPNIQLLIYQGV